MKKSPLNYPLYFASILVFIVACIHIMAIILGAWAYDFFDAKEFGDLARNGSFYPAIFTSFIVIILFVFTGFAIRGAIERYRTKLIQKANFYIGLIFFARGLAVLYFSYLSLIKASNAIDREILFSIFSLVIGILYLTGSKAPVNKE